MSRGEVTLWVSVCNLLPDLYRSNYYQTRPRSPVCWPDPRRPGGWSLSLLGRKWEQREQEGHKEGHLTSKAYIYPACWHPRRPDTQTSLDGHLDHSGVLLYPLPPPVRDSDCNMSDVNLAQLCKEISANIWQVSCSELSKIFLADVMRVQWPGDSSTLISTSQAGH